MTAVLDHLVTEEPDPNRVVASYALAHRTVDFERQPHAILSRSAVPVRTVVLGTKKRSHGVRVRVVELDPIEAGLACSPGSIGEDAGQYVRQFANVRQV